MSSVNRRTRRTVLTLSLALAVLALLAFGLTRDTFDLPSALIGDPAPSVRLEVMEPPDLGPGARWRPPGMVPDTVRLGDHDGEVAVVNFWASWCLACREEHAALSTAAETYRDRGVRFFGVLYEDRPRAARRWIRKMGGQSYPTLLDPGSRTAIDFGVYGVPETYFIGRDDVVAHKHVGPVSDSLLSARIESLLADSAPAGRDRAGLSRTPGWKKPGGADGSDSQH